MADNLPLDRTAMRDRSTSHLRIYVGGLTDKVTADDVLEHFSAYGRVMGIVVSRGFGFVQFDEESQAQNAISGANGTILQGKTINVKTAMTSDKKPEVVVKKDEIPPAVAITQDAEESYGANSYDNDNAAYDDAAGYNRGQSDTRGMLRGRTRGARGAGIPPRGGRDYRDRSPIESSGWGDRNPYDTFYPSDAFTRPTTIPDKNDCEIIVVSKTLTEYAEYIEDRLKRLGVVVDLLFPMEDVPIGKVLGNIASRGCLYAILVMPENQEHRSLTLNILHGLPQEHRNMPLEDALQLISRNFQDYRRGGTANTGKEAVFALLGQLADGKSLTALQYDKVIQYLQERKEQQVKIELGEPIETSKDKTQQELQNRIMSILNNSTAEKKIESKPIQVPTPQTPAPKPKLLNDPSVKKALDSLLHKFI